MHVACAAALALAALGCGHSVRSAPVQVEDRKAAGEQLVNEGLSGTATDLFGRVWAAPEERDYLYRFDGHVGDDPRTTPVPLLDRPIGIEIESLAWLDRRHLVLGTEQDVSRSADRILVARLSGGTVRVLGWWMLSWEDLWGIEAAPNEGIEALCAAGGIVVAGGEPTVLVDGERWAPIATARLLGRGIDPWIPSRLRLTTATGKLAAMDCSVDEPGEIEAYGVERDYGVTRLLRFEVPIGRSAGRTIVPQIVADLAGTLDPLPNIESVSVHGERLLILTDHDRSDRIGATEALWLGPLDD